MLKAQQATLARLLATENIDVVEKRMKTAAFDVNRRILYLPIWKDVSKEIYDLLCGHEVGHAKYTVAEGWHDAVVAEGSLYRGYLNVVEDARIEKLIQRDYPGLRRQFIKGYKQLVERGFFGDLTDLNSRAFIDRINVHFKVGSSAMVRFSAEEQSFVDEIAAAETWEEIADITKRLFKFCADQQKNIPETDQSVSSFGSEDSEDEEDFGSSSDFEESNSESDEETGEDAVESEESDDDEAGEAGSESEESDGEAGEAGSESEESDDEAGSESEESDDEAGSESEESDDDESTSDASDEKGGFTFDDSAAPPAAETDEQLRENLETLTEENRVGRVVRLVLPKTDPHQIVVTAKQILESAPEGRGHLEGRQLIMKEFEAAVKKNVAHMIKEFETRKAGALWARATSAKKGTLDPVKMSQYQVTEDIFQRRSVLPEGKDHGFIVLLDWSGSMKKILRPALEQTIALAMVWRQIGVPFRVYAFSNKPHQTFGTEHIGSESIVDVSGDRNFNKPNTGVHAAYSVTRLLEFFKDGQSKAEFKAMAGSLLQRAEQYEKEDRNRLRHSNGFSGPRPKDYGESINCLRLGGTPLNDSINYLMDLAKDFRESSEIQILNTVIITDGESNMPAFANENGPKEFGDLSKNIPGSSKKLDKFVVVNGRNGSYVDQGSGWLSRSYTRSLFALYREYTGSRLLDYFLVKPTHSPNLIGDYYAYTEAANKDLEKRQSDYRKTGYSEVPSSVYDKSYIINGKKMSLTGNEAEFEVNTHRKSAVKNKFMSNRRGTKNHRKLLTDMIDIMAREAV